MARRARNRPGPRHLSPALDRRPASSIMAAKAGAVGSLWDVVRDRRLNHRPEVVAGVLAEESTALLDAFFRGRR